MHPRIRIERGDQRQQLRLITGGGQSVFDRGDPHPRRRLAFARNIDVAGGIITHQHHRQRWGRLHRRHSPTQVLLDGPRQKVAS
jgi:hypothetical protein